MEVSGTIGSGRGEGGTYIVGCKRRLRSKGMSLFPRGMQKDRDISIINRRK